MTEAAGLAFAAGVLGCAAALDLGREALAGAGRHAPGLARSAGRLVETVLRAGREGRDPGAAERRRLLAAGGLAAFLLALLVPALESRGN